MKARKNKKQISPEIESQFKELASTDWEAFKKLTGVDLQKAYICLQRKRQKSLGQIAQTTGMPRSTVADVCKTCTD